ncbi:carbonic anhydrase [Corynebacterium sp. TAE3-ERU16]|uniref:carbonic anhydrase n=1 Tax=Corynebacterium sp. TAE3-ERU16 TaxID=2849493 RepID=UPI001C454303|nr:carbonic anhydrase [Corynebacterium sp. TAE3-ERU16]MBV7294135.1 carbonic anhydrase [Corynebacterium sp. TAE3-ERU16]
MTNTLSPDEDRAPRNPKAVWAALMEGNRRFMNFSVERPNQDALRRSQLTQGQEPLAVVLACSDSRVPVELIFDQGLGDVFVIRTAGEIIDLAVLGSLEYAVESLHVPLVVVLGHESCGAVGATMAALDGHEIPGGFQRVLIEKVSPSILDARAAGRRTIEEFEAHHVAETVDQVLSRSPEIKARVSKGTCGIVGVRYRLYDGMAEPVVTIGVNDD